MSQTAKLPTFVFVSDYHEEAGIKNMAKALGLKVKTKEIGYCVRNNGYCFLVYEQVLPDKIALDALKKKHRVELDS